MRASLLVLLSLCIALYSAPCLAQRFVAYVDDINNWDSPEGIATDIGVPGYAAPNDYNVIILSFWMNSGPQDAVELWGNPLYYVGTGNPWGNSNADIQLAWIKAYHSVGQKVLISAFGGTETPTSSGYDPVQTAQSLAQFVKDNQLDGVDLDYEDSDAMGAGTGVPWLVNCTNTLRNLLPASEGYLISHAPQAPYFSWTYPQSGYLGVDQQVGWAIDWYNVQFYNQGSSSYSSYQTLFVSSDGWSNGTAVLQINNNGVDMSKLVVGKPVASWEVDSGGYVDVNTLQGIFSQALQQTSWSAGAMGWEYSDDLNGDWIGTLAGPFNWY